MTVERLGLSMGWHDEGSATWLAAKMMIATLGWVLGMSQSRASR